VSLDDEVGVGTDDEAVGFDGEAFPSGTGTDPLSVQPTINIMVSMISNR
jgi:hypothetical protein